MDVTDLSLWNVWMNVLYLLSRYIHVVAAMLLVGGILFYEMVVPIAISDLREESQVAVFARARWVFRWVIWIAAAMLIITGIHLTIRRLHVYIESEFLPSPAGIRDPYFSQFAWPLQTGWWWAAHVMSAVIAILIALYLVAGNRPPIHPLGWLRMDLMILLVVVFFAVVTRQVDQIHQERRLGMVYQPWRYIQVEEESAATQPATQPGTTRP